MFKKRHIQVSLVKESPHKEIESADSKSDLDLEAVTNIIDEHVIKIGTMVFIGVGGLIILKTACKIAENLSNPANWR